MSTSASEVVVAGVRSPVLQAGPLDAREAAVFVHGNPGSTDDWAALVRLVGERGGRAIALDMPGFGRADKPEGFSYSVEGYAQHLDGALRSLGVDRAHLVLHDFGGPWGLQWAADHPDAFASATLINTGVLVGYKWHTLARIWRTRRVGEAFFAMTDRRGLRLTLKRGQPVPLSEERIDAMYAALKDPGTKRAVLRLYRDTPATKMGALSAALRPLDRPCLVVWGEHDPYIKLEQADRQRQTFPSARVVVFPNAGHWPMYDQPDQLAEVVVPFLAEQLSAVSATASH
jgi:pimeloyl-ACP methyl ester carboxylesterase